MRTDTMMIIIIRTRYSYPKKKKLKYTAKHGLYKKQLIVYHEKLATRNNNNNETSLLYYILQKQIFRLTLFLYRKLKKK